MEPFRKAAFTQHIKTALQINLDFSSQKYLKGINKKRGIPPSKVKSKNKHGI
jgi:hypothetical protein